MSNVVCFHDPDELNGYFSNWYLSDFEKDGIKFSSMEQYMMYKKAVTFGDGKIAQKILQTDDVREVKALGREVGNYNDTVWNGLRQIVIYEGLLEKFRQNPELKEKLLATGSDILAECAVRDKIWGIGCSMTDEERKDMSKWTGKNLLGFALMAVREKLRAENKRLPAEKNLQKTER